MLDPNNVYWGQWTARDSLDNQAYPGESSAAHLASRPS
jgi:hypothetical protein